MFSMVSSPSSSFSSSIISYMHNGGRLFTVYLKCWYKHQSSVQIKKTDSGCTFHRIYNAKCLESTDLMYVYTMLFSSSSSSLLLFLLLHHYMHYGGRLYRLSFKCWYKHQSSVLMKKTESGCIFHRIYNAKCLESTDLMCVYPMFSMGCYCQ